MAEEFDNRIRLPATLVDFSDDVGTTGQDHDEYPPTGQARFDHMRLFLIGLLACQSSEIEPTEKRTGTLWFNRGTDELAYEFFNGSDFTSIANAIRLSSDLTLAQWFAIAQQQLATLVPKVTWSGSSVADDTNTIPVPQTVQDAIAGFESSLRPLVYINGKLVDPRNSRFSTPATTVELLSAVVVDDGDEYTVITDTFDVFVPDEVVTP